MNVGPGAYRTQRARNVAKRRLRIELASRPLDPVVLGTAPAPIDNEVWADACIMLTVLAKTQPEKVLEFFNLTGDRREKMAFLFRHGHTETWRKQ